MQKKLVFSRVYSGESAIDMFRDIGECFSDDHLFDVLKIPHTDYYIPKGSFKVCVEWIPDEV